MLLRRGDAQAARWPCTCANLHIMVYLSEVYTYQRSCITQRNFARRRRAAIRPRQLRLSTVRRAPRAAARCPQRPAPAPPVMHRLLSFYKLKERAPEEPAAKRRRT